ncbi:hypothetical protein D3C85_531770 [compost metagenome]
MKKIIVALFFMTSFASFSQQLQYKSGGTVYSADNKKLSPDEVRKLLSDNTEALALYNAGRSKKTWGNVLFYSGLGLITTNLIVGANTDNTTVSGYNSGNPYSSPSISSERTDMTAAIIGSALLVASIPIKIGYPKKIKSALTKYNDALTDNYIPSPKITLLASTNQVGFRFEF